MHCIVFLLSQMPIASSLHSLVVFLKALWNAQNMLPCFPRGVTTTGLPVCLKAAQPPGLCLSVPPSLHYLL